jgi:transcriptional regulator with XRE-family HTH domain
MSAVTMTTGTRIAEARSRAGLSQRALADRSGVSQATLSRMEAGTRTPKMGDLLVLARAIGCSVAELSDHSPIRDRVVCFARAENGSDMSRLRNELVHTLEPDAFLDEYGIE